MKKLLCAICSVAIIICSAFMLTGCKDNTEPENYNLQFNKKYYSEQYVANNYASEYYIFNSDGTGEYVYTYLYNSSNDSDYTIKFKYTFTDKEKSTVICFYDGVESRVGEPSFNPNSWRRTIMVSKNVILIAGNSGYYYFINEDYLSQIPNYRDHVNKNNPTITTSEETF